MPWSVRQSPGSSGAIVDTRTSAGEPRLVPSINSIGSILCLSEAVMNKKIQFTLNGKSITREVASHRLLLDLLRDEIGLTGTKEGCGTGDCGACTGLMNGKPVNSCLFFFCEVEDYTIDTIEYLTLGPD